jgi:plasmid stabilization system protein ParE
MTHVLLVKPEAIVEIAEIHAYHKQIGPSLADRFGKELDACFKKIMRNPEAYPVRKKNYRHILMRRFRYRVVFALIGKEVVVFQVRHTSRKPSITFGP